MIKKTIFYIFSNVLSHIYFPGNLDLFLWSFSKIMFIIARSIRFQVFSIMLHPTKKILTILLGNIAQISIKSWNKVHMKFQQAPYIGTFPLILIVIFHSRRADRESKVYILGTMSLRILVARNARHTGICNTPKLYFGPVS